MIALCFLPDIPAALLETIPDHRVSGGRLTCKRCELRECLTACYSTYGCAAVDYDWQFHQCYVHTLSDVCGPLIAFINVTHYRRLLCCEYKLIHKPDTTFVKKNPIAHVRYFKLQ